jgi:alpha-1,3-rhamnosyl/mannosyltransferase
VRLGINLLWLVPGVVGGSEEQTTGLLDAITKCPPRDVEITLFALRPFVDAYPELSAAFPTVVCRLDGRRKGVRVAAEATWLLAHARRRGLDLLHHAGGTIPFVRATPSLLTIHDLQPLLMASNFSWVKRTYLRRRLPSSARRARAVITMTEYTRGTVVERLGVSPERVVVVPPALGSFDEVAGDLASTYAIDGPFFLYPAITYPHKNHVLLVRAFADVVALHPDAQLVLTGGPGPLEDAVRTVARERGVAHRLRRVGRIPRRHLMWMYRHATALTFPSLYEGSGLPVLEAMDHGCPVIAADATALPEVVAAAGMLVDPHDPGEWTKAMLSLLEESPRREALRAAGLARAAQLRSLATPEGVSRAYSAAIALAADR